jgi:threonine/homoserine/homoserine lactone efflux protein
MAHGCIQQLLMLLSGANLLFLGLLLVSAPNQSQDATNNPPS